MTVELTHSQVTYEGDNVATAFPTTFRFINESHLVVQVSADAGSTWTTLVRGTQYEVAGAGDAEPGGTVTLTGYGALPVGRKLRITRETPRTQDKTVGPFTKFTGSVHELIADKLTMIVQEQERRLAALEVGQLPVNLDSEVVYWNITPTDPIEGNFPFVVPCSGTPVAIVLVGVDDLTVPAPLYSYGADCAPNTAGTFAVRYIEGLTVGHEYDLRFLVVYG